MRVTCSYSASSSIGISRLHRQQYSICMAELLTLSNTHRPIERIRLAAQDRQGLPLILRMVPGDQHDLADVVAVVAQLPLDRADRAVRFAADVHCFGQIVSRQ